MRFTVLALDYDGTIARDGVLEPEVRRAIAEARERGITVAIVTGRILDDLRRRGISIEVGQCVIEADARAAPHVLDAIRTLELPYAIVFNRGRLMVLPTGAIRTRYEVGGTTD